MGDEGPPKISLVAETDPAELEKSMAQRELGWDIADMAANLLRVMRGAGKPHLLPQQIINLGGQILEVHKTARAWAIWSAIEDRLHEAVPGHWDAHEHEAALGSIARGSLQYLASRLVHQNAQEAAGRSEMHDGIDELERYIKREREKVEQELAAARQRAPIAPSTKRRGLGVLRSAPKSKKVRPTKPPSARRTEPETEKPKSTADFMKMRRNELRDRED